MGTSSWGFHVGPGGNRNGIGEQWFALDAAGISATLKSADDYGPCGELAAIAAASGINHHVIYRLSTAGQNDGFNYDVPNYNLSPDDAAALHWQKTKARLPASFDKQRVWVELVNEVDKNRADWLGRFAVAAATRANADGFKVALFGWSAGEPEPNHWELPGMLAYLDYCGARPSAAAISLHEYSYDRNQMAEAYPHLIGRFLNIINTCAAHNIPYPTVHITEWGWEYQNVPDVATAMNHIAWANSIYAPYPNVKGMAIWYLGGGFGDIANQTQKLIAPVTAFNLANVDPSEPDEPTDPPGQPIVIQNAGFEVDWGTVSSHDAMRITDTGIEVIQVGNIFTPPGWMTWFRHREGELAQPEARDTRALNPNRMRSGIKGQLLFTFYRKHDAGFWQRVVVGKGKRVRFSAYAHAWSSQIDNPRWSEGAGEQPFFAVEGTIPTTPQQAYDDLTNFRFWVGIDPTGGTNPLAGTVVWGAAAHIYNAFAMVPAVEVTTQADTITVFMRSDTRWAFKHNDAYWDDCTLELVADPDPPTPPVNYKVTAHLTPQSLARAEYDLIADEAVPLKQSVVFSADDAARLVAPGLPGSKVVAWWPERWQDDIVAWLKARGVTIVETRPQSPPTPEFSLSSPVSGIPLVITSGGKFNAPRDYSDPRYRHHEGLDLKAVNANGQPVKVIAAAAGLIDGIRRNDPGDGYGLYVRTKHTVENTVYYIWYGHLGAIPSALAVGQSVTVGQQLGVAGNSGNSTGIHLHLTVQRVPGGLPGYIVDSVIDPAPLLGLPPTNLPGPNPEPPYKYNGPPVTFSPALHAPGSDGEWLRPQVQALYDKVKLPVKWLSNGISADYWQRFNKPVFHLIRVFWKADQKKTPQQAWDQDIKDGVLRFYANGGRNFELLNEVNIEGVGVNWNNGDEAGAWLVGLATIIRGNCPEARLYFPGMSPGVPWTNQFAWTNKAWPMLKPHCHGFCLHAYTGIVNDEVAAAAEIINQVKEAQVYLNLQVPLVLSEASVNRAAAPAYKARVYRRVENGLRSVPGIQAVCWFISSWENAPNNEDSNQESWVKYGIGEAYSNL